jgi:hypothetical protein
MKLSFFPLESATPESNGEMRAMTKKENEIEYEYKTVFIISNPKKSTLSLPSAFLVTLLK